MHKFNSQSEISFHYLHSIYVFWKNHAKTVILVFRNVH